MERQKTRLSSNSAASAEQVAAIIKELKKRQGEMEGHVSGATKETDSKKFRKVNEQAKKQQEKLDDVLDKVLGLLDGESLSSDDEEEEAEEEKEPPSVVPLIPPAASHPVRSYQCASPSSPRDTDIKGPQDTDSNQTDDPLETASNEAVNGSRETGSNGPQDTVSDNMDGPQDSVSNHSASSSSDHVPLQILPNRIVRSHLPVSPKSAMKFTFFKQVLDHPESSPESDRYVPLRGNEPSSVFESVFESVFDCPTSPKPLTRNVSLEKRLETFQGGWRDQAGASWPPGAPKTP